jgi:hypothetical protein
MILVKDATEHVQLTGAVEGRCVIRHRGAGGELVNAPESSWVTADDQIGRELSAEEWQAFIEEHGRHVLPADDEG